MFAYLTFIVVMDRNKRGLHRQHIADGTIASMLHRYLELVEVKE